MSNLDRYIDLILERVEVNKDEHRNLKSELTSLLNEKKENYIQQGLTENKAIEKTIEDFGEADEVGKALSKSFSPQRTIAMYLLAIISVIFTVFVIFKFSIENIDLPYLWISIIAILTVLTIFLSKKQLFIARYRMIFILFCFFYILVWFYGIMLADGPLHQVIPWISRVLAIIFLILIIVNMILGAIYQPVKSQFKSYKTKNRIFIVICNTLSGMIVIFYALLILVGFLIFGSAADISRLLPAVILTFLWLCSLLISSYRPTLIWLSLLIQIGICGYLITVFYSIF
ncbi:permease prefix domain 1-containing protein [Rummeliibacillus sp. NPDC094406]|uniref:permease prefix domain 1-containing protein n=1 Tax=Rummeliibacillus sp. NPDC094406 TaxID=3364511 RepID=UPI003825D2D1